MKELIVIDTNIIVNALKSPINGAKSRLLIKDILSGKFTMCVSEYIVEEYDEVLHRPELKINRKNADWIMGWIKNKRVLHRTAVFNCK